MSALAIGGRHKLPRRNFLQLGSAGILGLSLADMLGAQQATQAAPAKAKSVILIWLGGGPATIDMWDMKPEAAENIRGQFKTIDTNVPDVQVCEHLPKLAQVMDRCTLIRSVTHTVAAHGPGTNYLMTGNRPSPALAYPSLGSLAARLLHEPSGVPSYMTLGRLGNSGAGYLGAAYNPFVAAGFASRRGAPPKSSSVALPSGFSLDDLKRREKVLRKFDQRFRRLDDAEVAANLTRFQQRALDILRSDKTRKALDLSSEEKTLRDSYGFGSLGMGALSARRLIEADVRFVSVGFSGWDTHSNNFTQLRTNLLPQLDRALSSLIEDLDQRGLLAETLVYCTGEFGRTPSVNGQSGRDHWAKSMAPLLAGGGLKPGCVYGNTDASGGEPDSHPCSPDDVSATIFKQLGIGPRHQVMTRSGRPVEIFREGSVIEAVIS